MAQKLPKAPSDNLLHVETGFELGTSATLGAAAEVDTLATAPVSSPGKDAWRRFRHNWAAMVSLSIIVFLILVATFAPLLHTMSPIYIDYGKLDAPPSPQHWFGTDGLGRDQYSRLLYGLRIPLIVGILGAAITTVLGMLIGVIAAYAGGWVDSLLSRFTDLVFAFPAFLLALLSVSLFGPAFDPYFGGGGRVIVFVIIFAIVGWPGLMRFVRSIALSLKEQQFVEAARTSGASSWTILRRHLLPNMYGLILVQAGFTVVGFIYTEAVLSILGLGVLPPNPDVGVMLSNGVDRLGYSAAEVIFPAAALTILILAFTFFGDGVRDAVDPRGVA